MILIDLCLLSKRQQPDAHLPSLDAQDITAIVEYSIYRYPDTGKLSNRERSRNICCTVSAGDSSPGIFSSGKSVRVMKELICKSELMT